MSTKSLSLRFLIRWILFFIILTGIMYLVALITSLVYPDITEIKLISAEIKVIAISIFSFFSPFIQLIIILLIVEWILRKFGVKLENGRGNFDWNVQTIIGIIIIFGFVVAALSGIEGVGYLKDIALVVVGFYFGTQRRVIEYESNGKKVKIEEEHTNDQNKNNS